MNSFEAYWSALNPTPAQARAYQVGSWFRRNQTTIALGAIALGVTAYWMHKRRQPSYGVTGTWTDLATKQGIAIGAGLSTKEVQGYLNHINANHALAVDGIMGTATRAALKKFQAGNAIPATGKLDAETGNALTYFAAATSSNPILQQMATVAPTYTPMLSPEQTSSRLAPVDIGQGWVMYGNCSCKWNDAECAKRCGGQMASLPPPSLDERRSGATAASGGFVTGIQSSGTFYDSRAYTEWPAYAEWPSW
jgi:Putative peptidoglycan binding domain